MFTIEQIEEIRQKLILLSKKDSEFKAADPLTGSEKVAIIQNNENRLVSLAMLNLPEDQFDPSVFSSEAEYYLADTLKVDVTLDSTGKFKFIFGIPKGERGISSPMYTIIFTSFEPSIAKPEPDAPIGGGWNVNENSFECPTGWNLYPSPGINWISTAFVPLDGTVPEWGYPIRISGVDGKDGERGNDGINGVDGNFIKYIYIKTTNDSSPVLPRVTPKQVEEGAFLDNGWLEDPLGVDPLNPFEWVAIAKKDASQDWSDWEPPIIWARYGINGRDGAGVEYIYKINSGELPENPTPVDWSTNVEYQKDEYVPTALGWTDEESEDTELSETNNTRWVCIRRYKEDTDGNFKWHSFSAPKKWSTYGVRGASGTRIIVKYATTDITSSDVPGVDKLSINPGSAWSETLGYVTGKKVWEISAEVTQEGEFVNPELGWQGPIIKTGEKGEAGKTFNYNITVYKQTSEKPLPPTELSITPEGWETLPVGEDNTTPWWQCTGRVEGATDTVKSWGVVTNYSGLKGDKGEDSTVPGPAGSPGPAGAAGLSGIPGVSIVARYQLGVASTPPPAPESEDLDISDEGWGEKIPTTTNEEPVIWCVQGTTKSTLNESTGEYDITLKNGWSSPFQLSGINGLSGLPGKNGQTIYPMGIYQVNKIYQLTDRTAPYVLDSKTGNFYILQGDDLPNGRWVGTEHNNEYPSDSIAAGDRYWVLMESFEAIHAKIGIIENGLVGEAVFNGPYMFSQQGKWVPVDVAVTNADYPEYMWFNSTEVGKPILVNGINASFIPAMWINLSTGEAHFCYGSIYFDYDLEYYDPSDSIDINTERKKIIDIGPIEVYASGFTTLRRTDSEGNVTQEKEMLLNSTTTIPNLTCTTFSALTTYSSRHMAAQHIVGNIENEPTLIRETAPAVIQGDSTSSSALAITQGYVEGFRNAITTYNSQLIDINIGGFALSDRHHTIICNDTGTGTTGEFIFVLPENAQLGQEYEIIKEPNSKPIRIKHSYSAAFDVTNDQIYTIDNDFIINHYNAVYIKLIYTGAMWYIVNNRSTSSLTP